MDLMEELRALRLVNCLQLLSFPLIHLWVVVVREVLTTLGRYLRRGPDQVRVWINTQGVLELGDIPLVVGLIVLVIGWEEDRAKEVGRREVDDVDLDTDVLPGCLRQLLGVEAILAASSGGNAQLELLAALGVVAI